MPLLLAHLDWGVPESRSLLLVWLTLFQRNHSQQLRDAEPEDHLPSVNALMVQQSCTPFRDVLCRAENAPESICESRLSVFITSDRAFSPINTRHSGTQSPIPAPCTCPSEVLSLQPRDCAAEKNQPVYITAVSASVDILLQGLPPVMGFSDALPCSAD